MVTGRDGEHQLGPLIPPSFLIPSTDSRFLLSDWISHGRRGKSSVCSVSFSFAVCFLGNFKSEGNSYFYLQTQFSNEISKFFSVICHDFCFIMRKWFQFQYVFYGSQESVEFYFCLINQQRNPYAFSLTCLLCIYTQHLRTLVRCDGLFGLIVGLTDIG